MSDLDLKARLRAIDEAAMYEAPAMTHATVHEAADRIAALEDALRGAYDALCEYACHVGEKAPCLRSPDQCAAGCGKPAGDALLKLEAVLKGDA